MASPKMSEIQIQERGCVYNQQSNLHVSVITPITKRTIHCTDTKVNAYYQAAEMVEEVNTYVAEGDRHLVEVYKNMKRKEQEARQRNAQLVQLAKRKPAQRPIGSVFQKKEPSQLRKNNLMFPIPEHMVPQMDMVFVPTFEKNIEIVKHVKEHVNVDFTYMIPKPVVIPIEVPVLKFKDNFTIIPVRKNIIPTIKYSDEVIYVDCYIEKPYIVLENLIVPVPCDAPIRQNRYIDKAPPVPVQNEQPAEAKEKVD